MPDWLAVVASAARAALLSLLVACYLVRFAKEVREKMGPWAAVTEVVGSGLEVVAGTRGGGNVHLYASPKGGFVVLTFDGASDLCAERRFEGLDEALEAFRGATACAG